MRRIVGCVFQTLDGVMQAPGGPSEDPSDGFRYGGWQMTFSDETARAAIEKLLTPPYALLLGRRTYDIFASFWPYVQGEEAEIGKAFTVADKYVLTRGDQPLEWENSHRLPDIDGLAEVKRGDGPDLVVWGSSMIYPALLSSGLLDRLVLLTYPLVLGEGKRLFGDGTPAKALRLVEHQVGEEGVAIATFEPAGEVRQGPRNVPPPNPREEERQRRVAAGTW